MGEILSGLFDTTGFPPRWHCGDWTQLHGWIHVCSDLVIGLAYFAIPVAITWLVRKRPDVLFPRVFWLFAAFIFLCGFGHVIEASLFWHPWYRFAALNKVATASASVLTLVALIPVVKEAIKIPGVARLNAELLRECDQREQTEEALRGSEERVRSIIDSALDGIVTINQEGRITGWNPEAERIFKWAENEVLGSLLAETILVADSVLKFQVIFDQLVAGGSGGEPRERRELSAKTKEGAAVPVEVAISLMSLHGRLEYSVFIRDLSESHRLDDRFRLVVESAPNAIIMVDGNGLIVLANAQAERLFGYERSELLKLQIESLLPERFRGGHPKARGGFHQHPKTRAMGVARDLFALNKRGIEVPVEIGLTPIAAPDGQFVLASVIDISERRRAEDELRASLREKEVLLKEVHHRVKNNLQIVSSLLSLQTNQVSHPEALAALGESRNRIRTMALVHEKLYQAEKIGLLDLAEYTQALAHELLSLYRNDAAKWDLQFELAKMPISIETAIPCALIINELLSNAFKYAFPDGRSGFIRVELVEELGRVRFAVKDNGVGFPAGFDPARTNTLGLQLVGDLARQLGGSLTINSAANLTDCALYFSSERIHHQPNPT